LETHPGLLGYNGAACDSALRRAAIQGSSLGFSDERRRNVKIKNAAPRMHKKALGSLLLASVLFVGGTPGFAADNIETIQATATGTSTQLGKMVGITVHIYEYSTMEDRDILIEAFTQGQNQGLVNALTKMRAVGRIAITGTLGYDLSYIRMIPTPTGRKIRFATNRVLRFGEVYYNTQSTAFNLTAGEFDLNDTDKSKSTGVLYPAAQLIINKDGELQMELRQNPWNLVEIIDWTKRPETPSTY
jgi:hypothetical protein